MKTILFIIISMLFLETISAQPVDVNIHHLLRANKYVGSYIKDTGAFGGYGRSSNLPKKVNDSVHFSGQGLYLKIDTIVIAISKKYNGYKLFLVNQSDSIVQLSASDSRISIIAEAYIHKKWQPIEYIPRSWCGNSYHQVYIQPNEYWEFSIPKFKGKKKTKIRYRLALDNDKFIYSNSILATINKKQLTEKKIYKSKGVMDPYCD